LVLPRIFFALSRYKLHGRAFQRGHDQILELAQRVRADHVFFVIGGEQAYTAFGRVHAEMVEPEPHHLFFQLIAAINGAQ
jgi:hypothetical protein